MQDVAEHEPLPPEELLAYSNGGRAWVAVDGDDLLGEYVLVDVVDGCAHVEQISVHPAAARQGIGRLLIDAVAGWAAAAGLQALTLITFRDVPWNGPYYERLGFRSLTEQELGPELRGLREAEPAKGLDPARRVCMSRAL
jgi:GNAT superfamily N-acetyltransferase